MGSGVAPAAADRASTRAKSSVAIMDSVAAASDSVAAAASGGVLTLPDSAGSASPEAPAPRSVTAQVRFPRDLMEAVEDTSRILVEIGARTDVTNESYYEDAFVDTTFLGRRLVNTPEGRFSSVLSTTLAGTRALRATQYHLQGEVNYGDRLQRGYLGGRWKARAASGWIYHFNPSLEYRHDLTFDRDLEEFRGAFGTGIRRNLGEGYTAAEFGFRGDFLRSSGQGAEFLLDRSSAGLAAAIDHLGLLGSEWRLGFRSTGRAFPDSLERDHLEHLAEGRFKWGTFGGPTVTLEALGTRRLTVREASTSRDNFWDGEASVEARLGGAGHWPIITRADVELFRYDLEDSTIFFNYDVLRGQVALRWEPDARWTLSIGPRVEALGADLNPGEGYQELGAVFEVEHLGAGSWWGLAPAAGWRDYDETPAGSLGTPTLHSSYAFYELNLIADQSLPGRLKLRILAAFRWEKHIDAARDAGSVYMSSELRWLP